GSDFDATLLGFGLVDQSRVEIGVDGHLLARHGIEGEACADFGNTPGTLGDHHEVDDHQNREHHDTDHVVAADHHIAESLDHMPGCRAPLVPMDQYHAGGRDVQRQPHQ